jgi:hypothetical protein
MRQQDPPPNLAPLDREHVEGDEAWSVAVFGDYIDASTVVIL